MTRGRPAYELLEHTADVGLLVRAPDRALLFERAALALSDVAFDVERAAADLAAGAGTRALRIEAAAEDGETLLVAFLGEILSLAATEGLAVAEVEVTSLGAAAVAAFARGVPLDPARHGFKTEVKAVTYHELLVSEDRDGGTARVLLDL